jgi:hypothetical protein
MLDVGSRQAGKAEDAANDILCRGDGCGTIGKPKNLAHHILAYVYK